MIIAVSESDQHKEGSVTRLILSIKVKEKTNFPSQVIKRLSDEGLIEITIGLKMKHVEKITYSIEYSAFSQ